MHFFLLEMRVLCWYFEPNARMCGSTLIYAGMLGTLTCIPGCDPTESRSQLDRPWPRPSLRLERFSEALRLLLLWELLFRLFLLSLILFTAAILNHNYSYVLRLLLSTFFTHLLQSLYPLYWGP